MSNIITLTAPNADLLAFANAVVTLADNGRLDILTDALAAKSEPVKPEPAKPADWRSEPAIGGAKQHIRIVAAELAIMDAYGDDSPIDGYSTIDMFTTKGDMSDRYADLRPYLDAVSGIDIRQGSAYWTEAAALVA
jgi:hypothetical protein